MSTCQTLTQECVRAREAHPRKRSALATHTDLVEQRRTTQAVSLRGAATEAISVVRMISTVTRGLYGLFWPNKNSQNSVSRMGPESGGEKSVGHFGGCSSHDQTFVRFARSNPNVPVMSNPDSCASARFALISTAPDMAAFARFVSLRSALAKLAPVRSALTRKALARLAPPKSALLRFSPPRWDSSRCKRPNGLEAVGASIDS